MTKSHEAASVMLMFNVGPSSIEMPRFEPQMAEIHLYYSRKLYKRHVPLAYIIGYHFRLALSPLPTAFPLKRRIYQPSPANVEFCIT